MKPLISFLLLCLSFFVASYDVFAWWVNWYYRSNWTYVQWYWRNDGYTTPSYTTYTTTTYTTPSCTTTYGFWAKDNSNWTCSCRVWYEWWTMLWKDYCVTKSCIKYGLHASLNYSTNQCECDNWYIVKTDTFWNQTCEKKGYSTYATLQEYKSSEAIVAYKDSSWFSKRSKITVYSCYDLENYVGWLVVLNLMQDELLNTGDYIVYGSSNKSCSISYSNNFISDDDTLLSCSDIYWSNSIDTLGWKCGCKTGYKWSTDRKSCVISTISSSSTNVSSCGKNSISLNGKCSCVSWYVWEYPDIANNYDCKLKTITCPDTVNWFLGTDNKCYCKTGYSWNTTSSSCKKDTTTALKCKKGELKRNGKCVPASSLK